MRKKNLVIVKSKTINNEAVPVVFRVVEVRQGEIMDERELSRPYVFRKFRAEMPLKYAKILVNQNPKEFSIIKLTEKEPTKQAKKTVKVAQEKSQGFICEHCGKDDIKSRAGLLSHIRYQHPEKWQGKKTKVKKEK